MTTLLLAISLLSPVNHFPPLESLANWKFAKKALILNANHKTALSKRGFFVTPGDNLQLTDIYARNDYNNLSTLITADTVVDIYHVYFDSSLRRVEEKHLYPDLQELTKLTLRKSLAQYKVLESGALRQEAQDISTYFGVADRLLGLEDRLPPNVLATVNKELKLISAKAGFETSPIFGFDLDYSQFIVRGHYTRSPKLGKYFETMMWFGLASFALEDKSTPDTKRIREAALLVDDLSTSGALSYWKKIYGASSLFAGASNALTPTQWLSITKPIISQPLDRKKLLNPAAASQILAAIKEMYTPKMASHRTRGVNPGDTELKLMGQRSIPDSVALSKLTGDPRPWPSALDIGAVLGSPSASRILDSSPTIYNPLNWQQYASTRNDLQAQWDQKPNTYWNQNLYTGFLDVLRKLISKPEPKAPDVMKSSQWADMRLSSALSGWAFLRHDTILYGEQSVAEMGDGDEPPPFVKGYIEPNLAVYRRLLQLVNQTKSSLRYYGYLYAGKGKYAFMEQEGSNYDEFAAMLKFFINASMKELTGKPLTKAEHEKIRYIEGDLDSMIKDIQLLGTKYDILSQDDLDMAQIADIHTSGNEALEVGAGHADDLIAIIPIEGKNYLARGSVMSFYEFKNPISKRMTDHQWKALVSSKKPARPTWINSYFINKTTEKEN